MDYYKKSKEELIAEIKEFKKREEGISLVLANTKEMFYKVSFDENGEKKVDYVSPQVEVLLGVSFDDYISNPNLLVEHYHPEDIDELIEKSISIKESGDENWNIIYRFYHKKLEKYIWLEESIVLVFDENGKKKSLYGSARDVTEKVSKEKQLSFILKTIDYCIYNVKFEKEGKRLNYISEKVKQITGLNKEEFTEEGQTGKLIERIHPDDVDMITNHIEEGLYKQKKKQIKTEFRFKPKGRKEYLWIEEVVYVSYTNEGEIIETTTVLRDISKSKEIELHLKQNEEKYRNIFTKNMAGVFITKDNKIIECNNSFAKIFGYKSRVELIGESPYSLYFTKKDRDNYFKDLNKKGYLTNYKIRHKKKDGSELWILTNVTKTEKGIEGTLIEITDQVRKEELDREKMRVKLVEKANKDLAKEIAEKNIIHKQLIENQKYTNNIINSSLDIICASDTKGNIIEINQAGLDVFGYKEDELVGKKVTHLYAEKIEHKKLHQKLKEQGSYSGEVINVKKNGEKFISYLSASLLYNDEGKVIGSMGVSRDITEEKWKKEQDSVYNNITKIITDKNNSDELYEGVRRELGKLINTDVFVISYLLNNDTITFPYYYDGVDKNGKINKPDREKGEGINEYFLKKKKAQLLKRKQLNQIIKGGGYKLLGRKAQVFVGVPLKIKNKTIGVLSVQSYDNENEYSSKTLQFLESISGTIALAVQRKFDESKIFEQSSRLKAIIENSTHLFWTYNNKRGLTTYNENFKNYIYSAYGRKIKTRKKSNEFIKASNPKDNDFWNEKYKEVNKGKKQNFIIENVGKNNERIVKEVFLNPIYNDEGKVEEVSGIAHDITQKTIAEEQLKESLKEKEILLKEVHHRVKNNLQVISSILNLQTTYVKEESTLNILKESQNRIKSMSFIHESLYQNNDFSKINFSEYITSLSKNLVHSYGVFDNFVDLDLQVKDVSLNLDQSIPCGLLVNELISNALKYAFPNNKKGVITIKLFEKNDNVYLTVKDNGVGLPKDFDYRNTETLGLQLVTTLIEQIDATIQMKNEKGVCFSIDFKKQL